MWYWHKEQYGDHGNKIGNPAIVPAYLGTGRAVGSGEKRVFSINNVRTIG